MHGLSADHGSRLNVGNRRLVINLLGIERLHDRDVVDHLRGVRQQLRYPGSAPAMLRELVDRRARSETSSAPTTSWSAAVPGARNPADPCRTSPSVRACNRRDPAAAGRRACACTRRALPSARSEEDSASHPRYLSGAGPAALSAASRPNIVASAATPSPRDVREKNCRRVS